MGSGLKELTARFLAHRHMLMAFIDGLVRDPAAAEDIFQEAWLQLAEAAERGIQIEDVARWSKGVAKNLILHYWRQCKGAKVVADSRLVDVAELAFTEQDAAVQFWSSKRTALVKCLEGLPEHSRDLLRLKYDAGTSIAQIATLLKRSCNGVMVSLARLRRALAECVEKRLKLMENLP